MNIRYEVESGVFVDLEVEEKFGKAYMNFVQQERREIKRQDRQRQRAGFRSDVSLDYLLLCGIDVAGDNDSLNILIALEEENAVPPMFNILSDFQKNLLIQFFVQKKSKVQIAKDENISESWVRKNIKEATQRIADFCDAEEIFCPHK